MPIRRRESEADERRVGQGTGSNSREFGGKIELSGRQCVEPGSLSLTCTDCQIYANDEQWSKTYCIFTLCDTSLLSPFHALRRVREMNNADKVVPTKKTWERRQRPQWVGKQQEPSQFSKKRSNKDTPMSEQCVEEF